jgi:hypothetical protein
MKFPSTAICTLCQSATAQTPDCNRSRTRTRGSHDKAAPPAATPRRGHSAVPVSKAGGDGTQNVWDSIDAEDARVSAWLKYICWGC